MTNDLKVTRALTTMVEEMKVIGAKTLRKGGSEDAFTEVMGVVAHSDRILVLLFIGGGMGSRKSIILKEVLKEVVSSKSHHNDMLQTAELVHFGSELVVHDMRSRETKINDDDPYKEEILDYEDGGEKGTIRWDGLGIQEYLKNKEAAKNLRVAPTVVMYLEGSSPLIVPQTVYASAIQMGSLNTIVLNFNITCQFDHDGSHPYLIRLHFCDIVSKSMNELYLNVYVGGKIMINVVDLSMVKSGLSVAYYKDVFVDVSMNGLEILRVNNLVNSLDGEFRAAERLGTMAVKWQKRPQPNLIGLLVKGSLDKLMKVTEAGGVQIYRWNNLVKKL
ncbi:probable receptor-like protein kinase [Tanacetum coccineum]